jgi:hypothetical protein
MDYYSIDFWDIFSRVWRKLPRSREHTTISHFASKVCNTPPPYMNGIEWNRKFQEFLQYMLE